MAKAFGQFHLSQNVPLVATQAANGTLLSLRWTNTEKYFVLLRLMMTAMQTANHTANLLNERFQAFVARSFTGADSVGSVISLTGNNAKAATALDTSVVTDARYSAVAAGVTVGTRTLDATPFVELHAMFAQTTSATIYQYPYEKVWEPDLAKGIAPIVLAANEGIVIRGPTTVFGAAGTANLGVELAWAEVDVADLRWLLNNVMAFN
jgi:hypothetical protein